MNIYTKTGDKGTTMLIGGQRVPKHDARVEAYGTIDELDAYIGLIEAMLKDDSCGVPAGTIEMMQEIRKSLFVACSFVACCSEEVSGKLAAPDYSIIQNIEKEIDAISATLSEQFCLLILGNDVLSSHINIARTICRRAERCLSAIEGEVAACEFVSQLLNRLSDYLYILVRSRMER